MELSNIRKKFGDKIIFDGFSASFPEGTVNWIMGRSGIGKTTLLRIIACLEEYEGSISENKKCAFMFQENRLLEQLSAVENIILTGADKADTKKYLLMSGLSEKDMHKPVSELSGGMKRRTALIRTMLYPEGELILMDEPFSGLDTDNRCKSAEIIKELLRGRTLIAVTHDASDTDLICGNIINL